MDGAEMVGSSRNLQLARFEELLVAPIQQACNLAVQQPARTGQYLDRAIRSSGDLRRTAVFPYLNSVWSAFCTVLSGGNIESLAAEQGDNVIEGTWWGLLCHKCLTLNLINCRIFADVLQSEWPQILLMKTEA